MKRSVQAAILLSGVFILSSCNTTDQDNALFGGTVGAVIGGVSTGSLKGAAVGGAIGSGAGVIIGRAVDGSGDCIYRGKRWRRAMRHCN